MAGESRFSAADSLIEYSFLTTCLRRAGFPEVGSS